MNDRIRQLRRMLDLTQTEFAERIGSVQNTITGYESGKRSPSNQVITLICKEFNVNEEWLRTGVGEMFLPDAAGELDALVKKYGLSASDSVLIEKYISLKPEIRKVFTNFIIEAAQAMSGERSPFDSVPDTPEELEAMSPPIGEDGNKKGLG